MKYKYQTLETEVPYETDLTPQDKLNLPGVRVTIDGHLDVNHQIRRYSRLCYKELAWVTVCSAKVVIYILDQMAKDLDIRKVEA